MAKRACERRHTVAHYAYACFDEAISSARTQKHIVVNDIDSFRHGLPRRITGRIAHVKSVVSLSDST